MIDTIIHRNTWSGRAAYSFLWVSFVLFFVYASIVSSIFMKDKSFTEEYLKLQSNIPAMFVNFGVMFMLVIDNLWNRYTENRYFLLLVVFSMFIIMALYGHAQAYFDNSRNYISLIKKSWISYLLQGLFVLILLISKYKTIEIIKDDLEEV
ncbi:MAG: hypothetical protein LBD59_06990 [Prevotellaceae bacterium]|jgi:hypothetical protein|nr:hypothetical protein [Prevotellaceae bacterium]